MVNLKLFILTNLKTGHLFIIARDKSILLFSHLFFFPAILLFSTYYAQYFAHHQIICSKAVVYVLCIYRYFYVLICIATGH